MLGCTQSTNSFFDEGCVSLCVSCTEMQGLGLNCYILPNQLFVEEYIKGILCQMIPCHWKLCRISPQIHYGCIYPNVKRNKSHLCTTTMHWFTMDRILFFGDREVEWNDISFVIISQILGVQSFHWNSTICRNLYICEVWVDSITLCHVIEIWGKLSVSSQIVCLIDCLPANATTQILM